MLVRLKLLRHGNFGIVGIISGLYLYNKGINADKTKAKMELKVENEVFPVPESLKNLMEEVKSEIKEDAAKKGKYELFISKGVDLTHFGFPNAFNGAYFGIPYNFLTETESNIDLTAVMDEYKMDESLTDLPELSNLKESMCLSKEAKKFALAREIFRSNYSATLPFGVLPIFLILNANFLSYVIQKFSIKRRLPIKISDHIILYIIGALFYAILCEVYSVLRETESDFLTCQLGSSYLQGGIEYYEKMMRRNKILKKIQKEAPFAEDGDIEKSYFRATHMSLAKRLTYLKEFKNERISPFKFLS